MGIVFRLGHPENHRWRKAGRDHRRLELSAEKCPSDYKPIALHGRLPISNIKAEHVAKTIAIARKNFLFADTEAGAEATARAFSVIESARANGHNPNY